MVALQMLTCKNPEYVTFEHIVEIKFYTFPDYGLRERERASDGKMLSVVQWNCFNYQPETNCDSMRWCKKKITIDINDRMNAMR